MILSTVLATISSSVITTSFLIHCNSSRTYHSIRDVWRSMNSQSHLGQYFLFCPRRQSLQQESGERWLERKREEKISSRDSENKSSVIRPGARGPESPAPNPQTIDQEWRQISLENCVPRSAVAGFSWSDFYYSRSLIGTFCIHHTNLQRILPVCRIWDKFVIFDIDF